jgi:hypothetical protein
MRPLLSKPLQEKIEMIEDERDYYIDLCNQLKEEIKILKQRLQLLTN